MTPDVAAACRRRGAGRRAHRRGRGAAARRDRAARRRRCARAGGSGTLTRDAVADVMLGGERAMTVQPPVARWILAPVETQRSRQSARLRDRRACTASPPPGMPAARPARARAGTLPERRETAAVPSVPSPEGEAGGVDSGRALHSWIPACAGMSGGGASIGEGARDRRRFHRSGRIARRRPDDRHPRRLDRGHRRHRGPVVRRGRIRPLGRGLPEGLEIPAAKWISAGMNWLVDDATFGLFTFTELTRAIAGGGRGALHGGAVGLLSTGFLARRGLERGAAPAAAVLDRGDRDRRAARPPRRRPAARPARRSSASSTSPSSASGRARW